MHSCVTDGCIVIIRLWSALPLGSLTLCSPRFRSVLFGTTNAAASLAGSAFVYAVGVILDRTQSWALVFELIAGCCLASAALFVVVGTSEPQFD
jgi:hypothetical protein